MVTMDDKPLFIDTNILIYANVATAPFHEQALNAIKSAHQAKRELWISRQVLREFCEDLPVLVVSAGGERRLYQLSELLPHSFGPADLPG